MGGWPSDQQISFLPLLNQDGVKVAGWLTGGQTCWGKKRWRLQKKKLTQIIQNWNWKQPKPLRTLLKLTSTAVSDLSDKVQAACRTRFLCREGPCSCRRSSSAVAGFRGLYFQLCARRSPGVAVPGAWAQYHGFVFFSPQLKIRYTCADKLSPKFFQTTERRRTVSQPRFS